MLNDENEARRWRRTHLDTILREDLIDLERVRDLRSIEILVELLFSQHRSRGRVAVTDGDGAADHSNRQRFRRIDARKTVYVSRTRIELTTPAVQFARVPEGECSCARLASRCRGPSLVSAMDSHGTA